MESLKSIVPIEIQEIVQTLSKNYEVYFVGGCVRDFLLGNVIHDYDCTTSATVEEMKEVLSNYKIIETGIKHGTLTIMNHSHIVEITTYRIDKDYLNHRFPSSVEFTRNIEEDLKRRDFTINALACDLDGKLIDYHHGIDDLNQQIIRCVGNPMIRFDEDALRILRAIRFSCTLSFEIEKQTKNAIFNSLHLLDEISIERKRDEFFKILTSNHDPLEIIKEYHLLDIFHLPYHSCMKALNDSINDLEIRLACLFYTSKTARKVLNEWHCSKKLIKNVCILIDSKNTISNDVYTIRKCIYELGIDMTYKILLFNHLDVSNYQCIINNHDYLDELAINGKDLIELGYQGKEINKILNESIDYVLHDLSRNTKAELIKRLRHA